MNSLLSSNTTINSPVNAAYELYDLICEHREETEHSRKLSPKIVEKLTGLNLFKMGLPKALGGWEGNPIETLKVYEILASAEASAAWVVWNNHLACAIGRYLNEECLREIYDHPLHIFANATRPEGKAEPVAGGYRVSGRWTLVSGCELADWFVLRCSIVSKVQTSDVDAVVPLKLLFIPKSEITVIDTWNVGGLNGTGSHDIAVENAFVKHSHAISFESPVLINNSYNRLPIGCINAAGCAAIALGVLKGAMDDLQNICLNKITPGRNPDLRDRLTVQNSISKSKTLLAAKRLQLYESVNILWEEAQNNNAISDEQLADVWSASCEAAREAKIMLSEIYAAAGTLSLYKKHKIERAHRDIHAISQHGIIQPHWMTQAGMAYLKIKPTSPMFRI